MTFGHGRVRTTIGLPGTGLYWTEQRRLPVRSRPASRPSIWHGIVVLIVVLAIPPQTRDIALTFPDIALTFPCKANAPIKRGVPYQHGWAWASRDPIIPRAQSCEGLEVRPSEEDNGPREQHE
jgi:hypothetical protein